LIQRKTPKIYFGWVIDLVTGITSGLAYGFYGLGISVLFKPITAELGLSRAVSSVASSIARLEGGIEAPITGVLSDKFGPKRLMLAGALIMGTGLVLMYFVNSAWSYYLVWAVIVGTGHQLAFSLAVDKVLTNWFVRKRGLALGIRFALLGFFGAMVLPIVAWLTESHGWRVACLIWGAVIFACIPLTMYFVKQNRPEYYGLLPDGAKVESGQGKTVDAMIDEGVKYAASVQETEFTVRQAWKTSAFWMLVVASATFGIVQSGITIHCIPFLTDIGIDPAVAGGMMGMMVFFQIPSRFFAGWLADRFRKNQMQYLIAGSFFLVAIGITVFLLHQTIGMTYVFLALYGFGVGATTPLLIAMLARYFGRKAWGSIRGSAQLFAAPISMLSPVYTGWVYDYTGSYISAFTLFAVLAAVAAFLVCFVRSPKPPAEVADVRKFI
jgi:sugar phosphate permease